MIVYLIYCRASRKGYVGLTTRPTLKGRWWEHRWEAKKGTETPLYHAIRKYGESSFEISILEETDDLESLKRLEIEQIQKQNTLCPNGYNAHPGGGIPPNRRGLKNSPEHIERARLAQIGKKKSPEAVEKNRLARIGKKTGPHSPEWSAKISASNKGKKFSPETIEKLRESHRGKKQSPQTVARRIATRKTNRLKKVPLD